MTQGRKSLCKENPCVIAAVFVYGKHNRKVHTVIINTRISFMYDNTETNVNKEAILP
jgi:hypothetical protein